MIRFAMNDRTPLAGVLAAVGLAATVAACTPLRWEHPQFGFANAEADQQECNTLAWRESWRYGPGFNMWDFPYYYRGRDGRLYHRAYPGFHYSPFQEERRLRDYCMRSKGYRMVPVPDRDGAG